MPSRNAVLLLLIAAPLFLRLGEIELLNPDEGRYAEIAREMVVSGDYLVPRLDGVPHWAKPPGFYWAAAASFRIFGFTPAAARLPSVLGGLATLIAVYLLARRLKGPRVALLSAAILSCLGQFFLQARAADPNALQAACIAWATYAFWCARGEPAPGAAAPAVAAAPRRLRPGPFFAGAALLGVSFVVKGPIALLVVAVTFGTFAVFERSWRGRTRKDLVRAAGFGAAGLAVVFAIGLPWFLRVVDLHPGLLNFYLRGEVVGRYFTDEHGRDKPWWFFAAVLLVGLVPWTPYVLRGAVASARRGDASAKFLLAGVVGPFVMFNLGGSKLWTYLLPLAGPAAILAASEAEHFAAAPASRAARVVRFATAVVTAAIPCAGAAYFVGSHKMTAGPWYVAVAAAAVVATAVLLLVRGPLRGGTRPEFAVVAATVIALHASLAAGATETAPLGYKSGCSWVAAALRADGADVRGVPLTGELTPAGRVVALPRGVDRIATYGMRVASLAFDVFPTRPESLPAFAGGSRYEFEPDFSNDVQPGLDHLVAELRRPERTYVVSSRNGLAEVEAALGRPLVVLASVGRKKYEIVLARSP